MTAAQKLDKLISLLSEKYPDPKCALHHDSPLQLLIATILSAQCTDERVNMVTPVLFEKYPTASAIADAPLEDLEAIIRSTGFFRNKARNIKECCRIIVQDFAGEVPTAMDKLLLLPGVARKTANVVLGNVFGLASGVVVDTHVRRLSYRLGLTSETQPEKIEKDLMAIIKKDHWVDFSHWLIFHGRNTCKARKPDCPGCLLGEICPRLGMS